ncbi:MAG: TIGR00282 family metallophosphoesterase [Alphaproteobacteria bacterium]
MKLLFLGDIMGRKGRDAVVAAMPELRAAHKLDAVVASGDNAAGGFGITPQICKDLFACGVDVITGGDHIWDQKETYSYLAQEKRLLRPHNFPDKTPGSGQYTVELANGKKLLVLHLLGQVFHKESTDCPFATADKLLQPVRLGASVHAILVDFHAEASSESNAMGLYLDGRVSAVVGSHTHVPTADARILPKGTAYQTDAGMCGDYNSVIGFEPSGPLERFLTKIPKAKMEPAMGDATVCGVIIETDDKSGLANRCVALQWPKPLGG